MKRVAFTARMQAPGWEVRNLAGEVITQKLLRNWMLQVLGITFLALIAAMLLPAILGGVDIEVPPAEALSAAPPEPPAATEAPPTEEATVAPTEEPSLTEEAPDR